MFSLALLYVRNFARAQHTHTQTHPFGRNALKSVSAAILRRILKLNISISLNKFRATFWMPRICPKRSALRSSKRPGKLRSYWKAVEGDDLGDLDEGNTSWAWHGNTFPLEDSSPKWFSGQMKWTYFFALKPKGPSLHSCEKESWTPMRPVAILLL